jgi:hypothetical protein
MSDPIIGPDRIDTIDDLDSGNLGLYEFWMGQEKIAEKEEDKWIKRARKVVKRYRDERPESMQMTHRFNILWSNVQTLIPTLYARTPKPDIQRRFKDQDDTGRLASDLLERCISFSLDPSHSDFDAVMLACVEDRLLPGRGVPRVLYVPHFGDTIPEGKQTTGDGTAPAFEETQGASAVVDNEGDEGEPLREVVYEEVITSYVFWEDYREGPARTWREVPWVRYQAFMTRDELVKRFGSKKGKKVNLDFPSKSREENREGQREEVPPDLFRKAIVREYWDKAKKRVIWIAPGTPDLVLDEIDDPLGLPNFFPNPDPLLATTTNDTRIPVPDFIEYQDQADELDKLTARIDRLTRALKVSGVYAGEQKQALQQLIDEGTENRLIPIEDWQSFADKGGMQNIIQWLPIKDIAGTLVQLYDARDRVKSILYEITGIGDIMRGNTQPNETLGAQQLKANFITRRVVPQQRAVARLARDTIRLMAAIIAGHFSADTISQITGYPQLLPVPELPPAPPQWIPAPVQQAPVMAPPPQQAPAAANANAPPPQALQQLREGVPTRFANGQRWMLRNGQAVRVA